MLWRYKVRDLLMQHSLTAQGYGIRLRPVRLEDAPFIVWLRNLDYVKGMVGDSARDVTGQERWLNDYFEREGDYYFIGETLNDTPLGTFAIYDLKETRAELGRYVVRPGVAPSGLASLLLLDMFYREMGLTQLLVRTVASNRRAHSLFRKIGFVQVQAKQPSQLIGGREIEMLHFVQTAEDWRQARQKLILAAQRTEIEIRAWEQTYLQNRSSQGAAVEN